MLYGVFATHALSNESNALNRLKKAMGWAGAEHHKVEYENFSGGFFLDPRLPYTVDDCFYLSRSNDLLVLMTGCIYNRADVCRILNLTPNSLSDPALVAHAFLQQGHNFVNSLNGDFSIAIYQSRKNALYLFRDHLGIAPLVYTTAGPSFYFSSDSTALCRALYEGDRIQADPLISDCKVVDMTLTLHKNVLKLKAGHFLAVDTTGVTIKKYWSPEDVQSDQNLTQQRMFSELKSLLEDAVHIRSDQRFRAGAHLSGGLDSSMVAVLARNEFKTQSNFYGYSWSAANCNPDPAELDERELVKQTCELAGIDPAFINVEVNDFVALTKNSMNSFMYFHEEKVLQLAHDHKTNLLFSGWGGDEFISFGSMGVDLDLCFNGQWTAFFKKNPINNPKKIAKYLLFRVFLPAINYIPLSVKKAYDERLRFLKKEYRQLHQETYSHYNCYRSRRGYQLGLLYNYHIPERTECWAVTGRKNGVEYRYPLLDKRIIEYMLKVPSHLLVKDNIYTRIILREISEGLLPETVRWRIGKYDPAFFSLVNQQTMDRGQLFIDEINEFKTNPDLYFLDLELLEQEIKKFKENADYPESISLLGDVLAYKSLHEFTKSYQQPINID